ncbi:hypothetical protein D9757_004517 [Collybiopsis confluens]|uniref:Transmembrane protein n=1 Tax=Collybiopsis confluens TaxID=2823264 RepID=A0A8H5HWM5_9AGAR|nr:hypothetical protein D9757_004517 [Collybiopsis confluens]
MEEPLLAPSRNPSPPPGYYPHPTDHTFPKGVPVCSENVLNVDMDDTSLRPHLGISDIRGGYIAIMSLFLLAVVIACMNHVVFSRLDAKELGNHSSQFWVTVLKNVFPAAVAFLLFTNLRNCLSQVALYHIQLDSHSIGVVNFMTSPPGLLSTLIVLFKSSMRASIISFAFLAAITQAVALTSLFVPGTLTVVPSPSHTQPLEVPTIDLNLVDVAQSVSRVISDDNTSFTPSQRWNQVVRRAALSNTAPEWDPPVGCGSACFYTFSYSAPALNCQQLSKKDIWPDGANSSNSRLVFGAGGYTYTFYNSTDFATTYGNRSSRVDLEVIYMENFNTTLEASVPMQTGEINPQQWSPVGVHCTYVSNVTYEATTSFSNNTQVTSIHLKDWYNANSLWLAPASDIGIASYSLIQSFTSLLTGYAYFMPFGSLDFIRTNSQVIDSTLLFNITAIGGDPHSDLGFFSFSLSPSLRGNLSAGLQDLLANVTLAFINEMMATTYVEASVTPNSSEYQYISWRLGLIYGVVFGFSLVVIVYGIFCLQKNGTVAVFDLQHILEMTATSTRLHECAAHSDFGSTMVRSSSGIPNGTRRRIVVLEVSD